MSEEEELEKFKQETLENWWVMDKSTLYVFGFVYCLNVLVGLAIDPDVSTALLLALISCLIWVPIGHVVSYFIVKKWMFK